MTSSDRAQTFVLHSSSRGYSCVESYKINGGPQQPFEYLILTISKKRLTTLAPLLMDDIRAGMNLITVYGFDNSGARYVVTNCKTNRETWKITAYPESESIRSFTTTCDLSLGGQAEGAVYIAGTPSQVIRAMVEPQSQALFASLDTNARSIHSVCIACDSYKNQFNGAMVFKTGTSLWYILSLCAMRLGCIMWVSNDVLYVIDFSLSNSYGNLVLYHTQTSNLGDWSFDDRDTIYLNTEGAFPYNPSSEQKRVLNNVLGTPDPGQEARNLIKNIVKISIDQANDPMPGTLSDSSNNIVLTKGTVISGIEAYNTGSSWSIHNTTDSLGECQASQNVYGRIPYELSIPEATRNFAQYIANNIATMYCDAEQPITFTMRETTIGKTPEGNNQITWDSEFSKSTRIRRIIDYSNDLVVSTASNLSPNDATKNRPAKGMISRWTRNFPEHTTTYTFGEIAPTDMTQNDSIIKTALTTRGL